MASPKEQADKLSKHLPDASPSAQREIEAIIAEKRAEAAKRDAAAPVTSMTIFDEVSEEHISVGIKATIVNAVASVTSWLRRS